MTISLHIIAKDEVTQIRRIVAKYLPYFDGIDIAIDDEKAFEELSDFKESQVVRVYHYEERMPSGRISFGDKRNYLVERCKTDWYFRLDTDDEIQNPQNIKAAIEKAERDKVDVLSTFYDYARDEHGVTSMAHYRETIIKNNGKFFWNKPIHECLIPFKKFDFIIEHTDLVSVLHMIDHEHSKKSILRNLDYLEEEYKRDGENTDSRTFAYLGRTYFSLGRFQDAIVFLEKHIRTSGWSEDRYMSWCTISQILNLGKNYGQSLGACFEALQECPDRPDAYFQLHDIYFNKNEWQKAIDWALVGLSKKTPTGNMFFEPSAYTWRPMLSLAECYFQIGDFERAYATFTKAYELVPNLDYVKNFKKLYEEAVEHSRYIKHFMWIFHYLKDNDPKKLTPFIKSVPKALELNEFVRRATNEVEPSKDWADNEITIFAGSVTETWSPKSAETGIGGSEEAIINLSKELSTLGWKVTVYNNCGDEEGDYDGVKYLNSVRFNGRDNFNVLISWRTNLFALKPVNAKRKLVWVHDLPSSIEWSPDVNKIIVLSEYHASLLSKDIPKDRIYISTNGIDKSLFLEEGQKQKKRIIYASSYNRGLEKILTHWKEIKSHALDAELHIYYGWNVYDQYVERGYIKEDGWKDHMLKLMAQDGVFEHGRIGHKELADEYRKADIFAYPCTYEGEINCIALTKALASGCVCLTNDKFALKERNPHFVVSDERFIGALIKLLRGDLKRPNFDRIEYLKMNSWESVARDWDQNLLRDNLPTIVGTHKSWVNEYFEPYKGNGCRIIDIGANKGLNFEGWDRKNITSIDIDEYDYEGFVRADACNLPFESGSFDKALMSEVLEHVADPIKALSEAKRVSKEVVITVPYEHEWDSYFIPFNTLDKDVERRLMTPEELAKAGNPTAKDFYKDDGFQHLYHQRWYTPETLIKDLKKAGYTDFKLIRIRNSSLSWIGVIAK